MSNAYTYKDLDNTAVNSVIAGSNEICGRSHMDTVMGKDMACPSGNKCKGW